MWLGNCMFLSLYVSFWHIYRVACGACKCIKKNLFRKEESVGIFIVHTVWKHCPHAACYLLEVFISTTLFALCWPIQCAPPPKCDMFRSLFHLKGQGDLGSNVSWAFAHIFTIWRRATANVFHSRYLFVDYFILLQHCRRQTFSCMWK